MSALYLGLAILLEVAGTLCMKASYGFTRPPWAVAMVVFYVFSFASLTLAVKKIDVSVAYAIWAGVGTALIAVGGLIWFKEALPPAKVASILLIIAGVAGLHLSSGGE